MLMLKEIRALWHKAKSDGEVYCKKNKCKPPAFPKGDLGQLIESVDNSLSELKKLIGDADKTLGTVIMRTGQAMAAASEYKRLILAMKDEQLEEIYRNALGPLINSLKTIQSSGESMHETLQKLKF